MTKQEPNVSTRNTLQSPLQSHAAQVQQAVSNTDAGRDLGSHLALTIAGKANGYTGAAADGKTQGQTGRCASQVWVAGASN